MLPVDLRETFSDLAIEAPVCRRVMLVDDELENLDVLAAVLEGEWEIFVASSGEQALEMLHSTGPVDLLIADQRMPGISGVELLARVAAIWPDTVRIVLTGFSDVEPMLEAINRGAAYRFLMKPFDAIEVRAIVADSLQLKEAALLLSRTAEALRERRSQLGEALSELQARQHQLLAAERLTTLGRATSGIVHDLRNAASILEVLIDLAQRAAPEADVNRTALDAKKNLAALSELLEQIRDFARSSAGQVEREETDLEEFLTTTLRLFLLEQGTQRCPIRLSIHPPEARLCFDRSRIRQALMALLRNAVLASPGGQPINLVARVAPDGSGQLEVRDHGHGMDEETLRAAQEPFFSGFSPRRTGLGLEVARLAAALHGGTFTLESAPGGTTARITLASVAEGRREAS